MVEKIKVLVLSPYYLPGFKGGGPIKTIRNLFLEIGGELSFRLITSDRDLGDQAPYEEISSGKWQNVDEIPVFYSNSGLKGLFQIIKELWKSDADIVYLNSFFSLRFSFIPLLLGRLLSKQLVLAPRGELSLGALKLKYLKKRVFIAVYKSLNLNRGTIFQASAPSEEADIKHSLGESNVDIYVAENIASKQFALSSSNEKIVNKIRLVFVSRISPKKNLLQSITCLMHVKSQAEYHIYGPIEDESYWEQCEQAIKRLPPNITVLYLGPLEPPKIIDTLSSYDMFFFLTEGENYGHVIAEALCAGLPLLISDTTPWVELEAKGLGWDISLDESHLFAEIIDAISQMNNTDFQKFRKQVLFWAKDRFSKYDAIGANRAMFEYALRKNKD